MSSELLQEVFQVIDEENFMCGLFTTLKRAQEAVKVLLKNNPDSFFQINRIPVNHIGTFSQCYDVVESYNGI